MRHYHGTPLGGPRTDVPRFARGRHFIIPFGRQEDLPTAADVGCGFCFDNGAFSAWKKGEPITDWGPYFKWCKEWAKHPRFDFALIPDVIDGEESDNDALIRDWDKRMWHPIFVEGVPVWHLHESLERLRALCIDSRWRRVALGSSGEFSTPGTDKWWERMIEAMGVMCDNEGKPSVKLHGLRMLNPSLVERFPFASADSTNVAQNKSYVFGSYKPPTVSQAMEAIACRIEVANSPAVFSSDAMRQRKFELKEEITNGGA